MAKSRFTHPNKHAAYEAALRAAATLSEHDLYQRYHSAMLVINQVRPLYPHLAPNHIRQVVAKALRVERGRRRKK